MNTDNSDNYSEAAALRSQVFSLLIALIVVSGTVTVYLFRQSTLAGRDLAQAELLSQSFAKNEGAVNGFVNQLVAYGQQHPDFVPVLKKYGIAPVAGVPPGAAAAPKK
jgi:hypothetical protein